MKATLDLQQRLLALGFNPGALDGIHGRRTIAAIKGFQASVGLAIDGVVGPKTITALNAAWIMGDRDHPAPPVVHEAESPPWFAEARRKIGLQEKLNNKTLRDYLKSDGSTLGDPAKLPWCGDLMETVIALTLPEEPMIPNPYWALNWRKFGVPIDIVALGAIAPFQRPGGGHIGQIAGHDKTYFHVLGGNQANAITITKIAKNRLSGPLRWPATYPLPVAALSMRTINATVSTNEV